jgi:hypothetical protein
MPQPRVLEADSTSCGYLNWIDKRASRLRRAAVGGPKPDRLTPRENGGGKVYQYSYSPRGEVIELGYPSGATEEWSYGANGDVTARFACLRPRGVEADERQALDA